MKIILGADAEAIRKDPKKMARILRSRWVLTDKDCPVGSPGQRPEDEKAFADAEGWRLAKARLVALGHTDPDLAEIDTYSPVLGKMPFTWGCKCWHLSSGNWSSETSRLRSPLEIL